MRDTEILKCIDKSTIVPLGAAWRRLSHSSCGQLLIAIIISSAREPHDSSQEPLGKFLWKALSDRLPTLEKPEALIILRRHCRSQKSQDCGTLKLQ
jgi:hypothetical protein